MLSLDKGIGFASALNRAGKREFIVYTKNETEKPDIEVDNPIELIGAEDIDELKKSLKLGGIEVKLIKKYLTTRKGKTAEDKDLEKLSAKLQRAIGILLESVDDKLKKELDISFGNDGLEFLPLMGHNKKFDRSFYVIGPSESGKSYFIKQILKLNDMLDRPVVLFSSVEEDDSLDDLKKEKTKMDKKEKLIRVPLLAPDDALDLPTAYDLKNCVCIFDDIDSLNPYDFAEYVRQYRDNLLQTGRHNKISVMSTSHQLSNYSKTKQMLTQAEWIILFPASNKSQTKKYLRLEMGLGTAESEKIIKRAISHGGRFLAIKRSAPQLIMSNKHITLC